MIAFLFDEREKVKLRRCIDLRMIATASGRGIEMQSPAARSSCMNALCGISDRRSIPATARPAINRHSLFQVHRLRILRAGMVARLFRECYCRQLWRPWEAALLYVELHVILAAGSQLTRQDGYIFYPIQCRTKIINPCSF